jgi:O-acetyl-ADP-ribose deacetylase (regulator of RNase III)
MTSKAFYKKTAPELRFQLQMSRNHRTVQVWKTSCIVTQFGNDKDILINPSNPELSGVSKFPYFPQGGPVPKQSVSSFTMHKDWQPLGHVSYWGNMDTPHGICFPTSVVDGLVHQLGGWKLAWICKWHSLWATNKNYYYNYCHQHARAHRDRPTSACPVGHAVRTDPGGAELRQYYPKAIVHTAPPFYRHDPDPDERLGDCYRAALSLAFETTTTTTSSSTSRTSTSITSTNAATQQQQQQHSSQSTSSSAIRVACPLLGAGARGFPEEVALDIASNEAYRWCTSTSTSMQEQEQEESSIGQPNNNNEKVLAFGFLEEDLCRKMEERLEQLSSTSYSMEVISSSITSSSASG